MYFRIQQLSINNSIPNLCVLSLQCGNSSSKLGFPSNLINQSVNMQHKLKIKSSQYALNTNPFYLEGVLHIFLQESLYFTSLFVIYRSIPIYNISFHNRMDTTDHSGFLHKCLANWRFSLRKTQAILDHTAIYSRQRWGYLAFFYAYVIYRIFYYEYLGLMYFMGLYIIYLIVQYFTPSGLPDPDEDTFENSLFVEETKETLHSVQGDRPILRSLNEFNLWKNLLAIALVSLCCTMFQFFLIPAYWPFLLIYFIWLIGLAVVKHQKHMKLYGYRFSDFNHKPVTI